MSLLLLFGNSGGDAPPPPPPPPPVLVDDGGAGHPRVIIAWSAPARTAATIRLGVALRVDGRVTGDDEEALLALLAALG